MWALVGRAGGSEPRSPVAQHGVDLHGAKGGRAEYAAEGLAVVVGPGLVSRPRRCRCGAHAYIVRRECVPVEAWWLSTSERAIASVGGSDDLVVGSRVCLVTLAWGSTVVAEPEVVGGQGVLNAVDMLGGCVQGSGDRCWWPWRSSA